MSRYNCKTLTVQLALDDCRWEALSTLLSFGGVLSNIDWGKQLTKWMKDQCNENDINHMLNVIKMQGVKFHDDKLILQCKLFKCFKVLQRLVALHHISKNGLMVYAKSNLLPDEIAHIQIDKNETLIEALIEERLTKRNWIDAEELNQLFRQAITLSIERLQKHVLNFVESTYVKRDCIQHWVLRFLTRHQFAALISWAFKFPTSKQRLELLNFIIAASGYSDDFTQGLVARIMNFEGDYPPTLSNFNSVFGEQPEMVPRCITSHSSNKAMTTDNKKKQIGVVLITYMKDGEIQVYIGCKKGKENRVRLPLMAPGGFINDGEQPLNGALREGNEETGLRLSDEQKKGVKLVHHYTADGNEMYFYHVHLPDQGKLHAKDDLRQGQWFPVSRIVVKGPQYSIGGTPILPSNGILIQSLFHSTLNPKRVDQAIDIELVKETFMRAKSKPVPRWPDPVKSKEYYNQLLSAALASVGTPVKSLQLTEAHEQYQDRIILLYTI